MYNVKYNKDKDILETPTDRVIVHITGANIFSLAGFHKQLFDMYPEVKENLLKNPVYGGDTIVTRTNDGRVVMSIICRDGEKGRYKYQHLEDALIKIAKTTYFKELHIQNPFSGFNAKVKINKLFESLSKEYGITTEVYVPKDSEIINPISIEHSPILNTPPIEPIVHFISAKGEDWAKGFSHNLIKRYPYVKAKMEKLKVGEGFTLTITGGRQIMILAALEKPDHTGSLIDFAIACNKIKRFNGSTVVIDAETLNNLKLEKELIYKVFSELNDTHRVNFKIHERVEGEFKWDMS